MQDALSSTELGDLVFRPDVEVRTGDAGSIRVRYAFWEVTFPDEVVRNAGLERLFSERRVPRSAIAGSAKRITSLLFAQGCFLPALSNQIRLRDILPLFQPLRSKLYADYYAHSVWDRLRSGLASRSELVAWIIHNYHISRSAGTIAARMASRASRTDHRLIFQQDALEEYWHCDTFYFANGRDLPLDSQLVKAYIPLAASNAFEEHALRAAEEDWLGHMLIAYFQESSILFRGESEDFYDAVEQAYGLHGYFAGWRQHMALDVDQGHATGLRNALESDEPISLAEVVRSVRTVQLAHFFLLRALDQVAAHNGVVDPVDSRQPTKTVVDTKYKRASAPRTLDESWGRHLVEAFAEAAFRALAFSRAHEEIIAAGRLATATRELRRRAGWLEPGWLEAASGPSNPWLVAVRNFIVERGARIGILLELGRELLIAVIDCNPSLASAVALLESERSRLASQLRTVGTAAVEQAQLRELLELVYGGEILEPLVLGESIRGGLAHRYPNN